MAGTRLQVGRAGVVVSLALALCWSNEAQGAEVTINPSEDNTIADGVDPGSGEDFTDNSSGACEYIFSGTTNDGFARRALLTFDIAAAVPAGSTITGVTLTMTVNRSGDNQDATMTLHSVSRLWGEGTATCGPRGGGQGDPAGAGDATWRDAEFGGVSWTDPGGDFAIVGTAADPDVGSGNGSLGVWSSAAMASDVQAWLDAPINNFGWILVGDEARAPTSRRFSSREGSVPPTLTIVFDPPPGSVACCSGDGACSVELDTIACSDIGGIPADPATETCEPNPCPQPTGACCNLDESCSDNVDRLACESAGGVFQGANNTCNQGNIDCGLTPFVDPLPLPPVLQPTGQRADGVLQYTVEVVAAKQQLHSELPDTDLWTYNGAYPSFTIAATKGEPIEVTYVNNLPTARGRRGSHLLDVDECPHGPNYYADSARISTHVHGAHVPARFDGQPEYTILPGEIDVYQYPNNQDASTMWYHDHALGITRLNVYSGMAGFYLLRDADDTGDASNTFGLPSGEFEIPIVIQDREFNPDGSLFYNPTIQNAFKGDRIVVNGKVWPFLNVKQGKYRFRMLNGSQAREYSLRMENLADPEQVIPFTLIGTDLGLITAPIPMDTIAIMAPAERMDVIVDFSGFPAGTEIVLRNDELTTPLIPNVMKFVVTADTGFTDPLDMTLRTVTPLVPAGVPTRYFWLTKLDKPCSNEPTRNIGEWLIKSLDGPAQLDPDTGEPTNLKGQQWDDLTEFPILGTREIWEFENPTNSMHPMHVHLVKFQVLDKTDLAGQPIPLEPWENTTWKDTVRVPPKSKVRVIMDFEDYLGKFPYHCHILDHEDHEMMRQFQTVNDPANCNDNMICDPGEDCMSCADCGFPADMDAEAVSGALCGNGLCEAGDGENCVMCPDDCAGKQKGQVAKQFCCGATGGTNNIECGVDVNDDRCIDASANLFCRVEPRVMACCGDALCEGQETVGSCAVDCVPCTLTESVEVSCFDGLDNDCDVLTDEADPDCQTPCVVSEQPEMNCFDGLDNDCDDAVDCADATDCDGEVGPATTCGVGDCASSGNLTCSEGAEVDNCMPGAPNVEGPFGDASCTDQLDNDCDGLTDADDQDCQQAMQCSDYPDRQSCRDAGCKWKQNMCQNP